jgi:hypothetical protein
VDRKWTTHKFGHSPNAGLHFTISQVFQLALHFIILSSSISRLRKNLSWKGKRFNNSSLTLKLMKKYHGKEKKKGSIKA